MSEAMIEIPGHGTVLVVDDAEALATAAANAVIRIATAAVAARGRAVIALSGGSTPKRMGELLATAPYREQVPWANLELFWGDERWAPESSPESNAGVARRTYLDQVGIAAERVHAWPTLDGEPETAAIAYEATIRDVLGDPERGGVPSFDLILLGMGDDGHTASLFPQTAALGVSDRLAVANHVPQHDTTRLTFTYPLLNAGREVVFLVGGGGKAATLAAVLRGPDDPTRYPAQGIQPSAGHLTWLVEAAAAAQLRAGTSGDA